MKRRSEEGMRAKRSYIHEYNRRMYDTLTLMLPKGERDKIKNAAAERGLSAARLVQAGVDEYIINHPV